MARYLLLRHYRGGSAPANDIPMDQWTPGSRTNGPTAVIGSFRSEMIRPGNQEHARVSCDLDFGSNAPERDRHLQVERP